MDKASPIHNTIEFNLADEIRLARKRSPNDFKTILNFRNTLSDGLKLRQGYAPYTGATYPTGLDATSLAAPLIVGIDIPEKKDVHILCMNSDPQVYMFPYYHGSGTAINGSVALAESQKPGFLAGAWSLQTIAPETSAHAFQILNANLFGFNLTTGYYNGWKVYNTINGASTIVTSYTISGTTVTFKCVDRLDGAGLNFLNIHTFEFYRSYHDNHSFVPTFNQDLVNPPCAVSDNSIIFFSGGQGSDDNLRGSIIYPRMNKTFFPDVTDTLIPTISRAFTVDGTYATEEEAKPYDVISQILIANGAITSTGKYLDGNVTVYIGIAPIYDGGIIGELQKYETSSFYGGTASQNFIATSITETVFPQIVVKVHAGTLNKTIQGYAVYMALDIGDSRDAGRQTPYYFVGQISVISPTQTIDAEGLSGNGEWVHDSYYQLQFQITQAMWDAKGLTYEEDSGMAETQTDTAYSYSGRTIVGGRHFLYNVYVNSTGVNDRQNIFTNPMGQNPFINSGIIQRRVFPNEEGYYKLRCNPETGTRINAIIPQGFDELLVLKERGAISSRIITTPDLIPEFINRIVDSKIGCSTFNGYAISNQEQIYFAGYDDCYVFNAGQLKPLIEREDKKDWLYTYREVLTNTQKENVVVIWLPQNFLIWDFGQASGNQYIFDGGWTQAAFNQSSGLISTEFFKFPCKLNNGSVLALGTIAGGVAGAYGLRQFQNPTTGAFYSTDAGIAIKYQLDTDYFNFGHDKDFVFNKIIFNRMFNSTPSGQLDVSLYRDRTLVRVYTLNKSLYRCNMYSVVGDPKIGFEWRFVYNINSGPEVASSTQYQIDSIEIYGELRSRSKRATEVTTVTDVMVWDVDSWDGGKSWG